MLREAFFAMGVVVLLSTATPARAQGQRSAPASDTTKTGGDDATFTSNPCANPIIAKATAGNDPAPREACTKKLLSGGLKGFTSLLLEMRKSTAELAKAGLAIKMVHFVPAIVVTDAALAVKNGAVAADGSALKVGARVKIPASLVKRQ